MIIFKVSSHKTFLLCCVAEENPWMSAICAADCMHGSARTTTSACPALQLVRNNWCYKLREFSYVHYPSCIHSVCSAASDRPCSVNTTLHCGPETRTLVLLNAGGLGSHANGLFSKRNKESCVPSTSSGRRKWWRPVAWIGGKIKPEKHVLHTREPPGQRLHGPVLPSGSHSNH